MKIDQDYVNKCIEIRKNGITLSPIGIGDEYNENLLLQIADAGGGAWLHVTDPHNQLPSFLREQVDDMRDTVAINPELKVELIPGAEILDFFSVKPILTKMELPERSDNQYAILLRDVVKGQEQTIVFRIKLPSQQNGEYTLLNASIMGNTMSIPISYTDDPSLYNVESDPNPRILLEAATGSTLIREGIDGNTVAIDQATKILDNIARQAETIVLDPSTKAMITDMQGLQGQTKLLDSLSENEKKDLKHGTTIIGIKKK